MPAILTLFLAATRQSWRGALGAGVLFATAQLVKPSLLLWPVAGAIPWVLIAFAYHAKVRWSQVVVCSVIQIICMLAWCARNYASDGLFTYSAVNARNLRMLVVPMIEEWVKAGREPQMKDYFDNYRAAGDRFNSAVRDGRTFSVAAEVVRTQMAESKTVIRAHPLTALRVVLFNLHDQLLTGWDLCNGKIYSRTDKAPTTQSARPLPLGLAAESQQSTPASRPIPTPSRGRRDPS